MRGLQKLQEKHVTINRHMNFFYIIFYASEVPSYVFF